MKDAENKWGEPLEARNPERQDAKLSDLLDDIIYLLPACPDLVIRKELMKVWRLFAEKTGCWKETVRVQLVSGVASYPVASGKGGVVRSIDCAWRGAADGRHAPALVEARRADNGWAVSLTEAPNEYNLQSYPVLALRVTLVPERNSEDIPQAILDRYGADIAAGVVGRLASQEGKPWANAAIAAQNIVEWENALHDASIRAIAPNGEIDTRNYEGWA